MVGVSARCHRQGLPPADGPRVERGVPTERRRTVTTKVLLAVLMLAVTGCSASADSAQERVAAAPAGAGAAPGASSAPPEAGGDTRTRMTLAAVAAPDGTTTVPIDAKLVGQVKDRQVLLAIEYADLCQKLLGAHVATSADTVKISVVATAPTGDPCPVRLASGQVVVELTEALDGRAVVLS